MNRAEQAGFSSYLRSRALHSQPIKYLMISS